MSINLNYRVQAFWNGSLVCDGNMSGVLALTLAQHMAESFTGAAGKLASYECDNLRSWLFVETIGEEKDMQINCLWGDITGSACIRVTRRTAN